MPVAYVSKEIARTLRAGRLLTDCRLSRVSNGWQVTLILIGGDVMVLRSADTDGSGPDETVFATSDSALFALAGIGFDLCRKGLGCWRPDPVIAEREHVRMRAIFAWGIRQLRRYAECLGVGVASNEGGSVPFIITAMTTCEA
ncbi:hypothetical protein OI25_7265 [Paraburkholderia fungorum]|jgi:hypothetical protein|uniref:Uncharacterized protein n=1 Tax=Paraburkholderia fungorum TaxID=134537 RepID=A0AAP5QEF5_9BURK|nr:hypothetical protein [Paraburkholderia fungorum]AJZ56980.1 hypothetical protein OI25_7265 [Paraburkholderia fungorum]MDT8842686.1 hypothetical protein [Paraburkholderia fungorum]PRZ49249.1 hypothetical protein BX589_126158 [Paraburkholderia fungorum]